MMVLNSYSAPLGRRDSWLERIEVDDDYADSPYERAADMLRQLGLADETIGFEKRHVSANWWEEIGRLLPRARIVNSTELMDRVRWTRPPRRWRHWKRESVCWTERTWRCCPRFGPATSSATIMSPTSTAIPATSPAASASAHPQTSRSGFTGLRETSTVPPSTCAVPARARPTSTTSPTTASTKPDSRATLPWLVTAWAPGGTNRNRTWVPSIARFLEEGIVVALEPHIGYRHLQDMVLVTDDAPRLLSP